MVSYRPSSDVSSSTPSSPSSPKMVNFAGVTGMSRAAKREEQWAFYEFEVHAANCHACNDPYMRYKAGKHLCREGNQLALVVNQHIYYKDSKVYSRVREDGQKVNVEIPSGYDKTSSLLKAVERSSRHKRTFLTAEKPTENVQPPQERSHLSARGNSSPKAERAAAVATPPRGHHFPTVDRIAPVHKPAHHMALPIRHSVLLPEMNPFAEAMGWEYPAPLPRRSPERDESVSKRGSLYETDMLRMMAREKREGQLAYNLEVREPVRHHHHSTGSRGGQHRHHRHSGIFF